MQNVEVLALHLLPPVTLTLISQRLYSVVRIEEAEAATDGADVASF